MTPRSPRRDVTDELISLYARIRIAHAQRQRAAELAAKVGSLDFPAEDAQAVELAEAVADLADGFDRLAGLPEGGD